MPNIVLTRIDNRLIHGQVATMWSSSVGANLLLVANDEVCTNEFRQGLMDMAAPSFAQTRYFSIEKTINIIHKASDTQYIAIICETPQDVVRLDENDVKAFRRLQELGVDLEIRRVPSESAESLDELFK